MDLIIPNKAIFEVVVRAAPFSWHDLVHLLDCAFLGWLTGAALIVCDTKPVNEHDRNSQLRLPVIRLDTDTAYSLHQGLFCDRHSPHTGRPDTFAVYDSSPISRSQHRTADCGHATCSGSFSVEIHDRRASPLPYKFSNVVPARRCPGFERNVLKNSWRLIHSSRSLCRQCMLATWGRFSRSCW